MVQICDALVRYDRADPESSTVLEVVEFCLNSLQEIRISYPVADSLQQMFRMSLNEQGISIPVDLQRRFAAFARMTPDDLLDACTRPTYRQPVQQIMFNMEPDLGHHFIHMWSDLAGHRGGGKHKGKQKEPKAMDIENMLNR